MRWISYSLKTAGPRGNHITRFTNYARLEGIFAPFDAVGKVALSVSGSQHLARVAGVKLASSQDGCIALVTGPRT